MAIALAAHGALVMIAPLIVPYLAPVEHAQPQLQLGNGAPFEGSGAGGAETLGTATAMLPVFVPANAPEEHPEAARDLAVPPTAESVPSQVTPSLDLLHTPESAEDQPDPLTRPTVAFSAPVTPPIALSAIVPDEPRPESTEIASATPSNEHAAAAGSQAVSPAGAAAPPPASPQVQGSNTGAPLPANPEARSDSGQSKGDGGGRTGDPNGVMRDTSWVRIRPASRIADSREYERDALRPPNEQIWSGTVVLLFDVNPRGRIYNVRVAQSSGNRRLDETAARDIADNLPPKWLWETADNPIPIIFKH